MLEITPEEIEELIEEHLPKVSKYNKMLSYYKGEHEILNKEVQNQDAPNNKAVNNYAAYITDLQVGYFLAKPIAYKVPDLDLNEMIDDIFLDSDEHDLNVEIAKDCSIYGEGFEILYIDEEGALRLSRLDPASVIPIYSNDVRRALIGAIRYYYDRDDVLFAEVYTKDKVSYYEDDEGLALKEEKEHVFNQVPIVHYINNEERMGDYEQVISLIDDYNARLSSSSDELEYFADAYLKIKGMSGTTAEDIKTMREQRAFLVEEGGDVDFVTKSTSPSHSETHLNMVNNNIHKFSKTPDLSDEKFSGNLSGVAIRYKMLSMEQVTGIKERKFKKALSHRLRMVIHFINVKMGGDFEWRDIEPVFSRNIPDNVVELAEIVTRLSGMMPTESLLALLPFVDDPIRELKLLKSEEEGDTLDYSTYQSLNPDTDNTNLGPTTLETDQG